MSSIKTLRAQILKVLKMVGVVESKQRQQHGPPSPQPPKRPEIAVLGAGIGGLALAIGLIRQGISVTIFEAAEEFSTVGAGIGFGPNALNAIDILDPRFRQMYEAAATANERPEFEHSVFDALYAEEGLNEKRGWTRGLVGAPYFYRSSAHRKDLLKIMEDLIPAGVVKFNKRAKTIEQRADKVFLAFEDGTSISVDTLIGCDGVKGATRGLVLGDTHPEQVAPTYCNMYIYRGIVPMEDAKRILGDDAGDAKWFQARDRGVAIYPISKGQAENFVFFINDPQGWTGPQVAVPCSKEDMLADLEGFDPRLLALLDYSKPSLRWPTFHHPVTETYYKGRVCLLGDVAHASSPHQAAGAGQGLEDAVVLSRLLAAVESPDQLSTAFEVYDRIRRPRAQKVVTTSYEAGEMYTFNHPDFGDNLQKIIDNANERLHWIWQHDLKADADLAEEQFRKLIGERKEQRAGAMRIVKTEAKL